MTQHRRSVRFALESGDQVLVFGEVRVEDFQDDFSTQRLLDAQIERGHATAADALEQLEASEIAWLGHLPSPWLGRRVALAELFCLAAHSRDNQAHDPDEHHENDERNDQP